MYIAVLRRYVHPTTPKLLSCIAVIALKEIKKYLCMYSDYRVTYLESTLSCSLHIDSGKNQKLNNIILYTEFYLNQISILYHDLC